MGEENDIKLLYKPGITEPQKYDITIESEQIIFEKSKEQTTNLSYSVEMVITERFIETISEDVFRSEYIIESGVIKRDGTTSDMPGIGNRFTVDKKTNGEIVSDSIGLPFSQPSFPEKPLQVGDSWESKSLITVPFERQIKQSNAEGKVMLKYKYSLEKTVKMAELECAVISVECPDYFLSIEPDFEQTIRANGKIYFAHMEGKLIGFNNETFNIIKTKDAEIKNSVVSKMELKI